MDTQILDDVAFAPATMEQWRAMATKVLKGADFDESLVTTTDDGIAIQPLAQRRASAPVIHRQNPDLSWTLTQRIDDPVHDRALAQLRTELANGATGLSFVMADSAAAYGTGLSQLSADLVATARQSGVTLRLETASPPAASAFAALTAESSGPVHAGLDFFTTALASNSAPEPDRLAQASDIAARLMAVPRDGTIINADGRFAHDCGATEAQELAFVTASLVESARILADLGISAETAFQRSSLCLAVDQNQYLGMAKLRALRKITSLIQQTLGLAPIPLHVYAQTSWRMLTRLDPETNVLRNTIATFAAGVAGADEISVLPHTLALGLPDPLARRLARNTQLVLSDECHLSHVSDPAAGSGSLEALTDDLAKTAWALFQGIEQAGGLRAALASGMIGSMIAEANATRKAAILVGTTIYPQKTERPVTVLQPLAAAKAGTALQPKRRDEATLTGGDNTK